MRLASLTCSRQVDRRTLIKQMVAAGAIVTIFGEIACQAISETNARPNFVVFLADDLSSGSELLLILAEAGRTLPIRLRNLCLVKRACTGIRSRSGRLILLTSARTWNTPQMATPTWLDTVPKGRTEDRASEICRGSVETRYTCFG